MSGRGGVNPFPPFFALGFFSFPKMDGGLRRHSTPSEMGGFPPLEERLLRMRTAAAMLLLSQFQFLASLIPNRIESTVAATSLVHRK